MTSRFPCGLRRTCGGRTPSRILYISFASPVPAKLGPARRNYHVLDQLLRFYDVSLLSLGTGSQAEMFDREFGDRVSGVEFVPTHGGPRRKFIRKVLRTVTTRCDFDPVLDANLREACPRVLSSDSFDAVFLSCVLLRGLPLPKSIPVVGDTHNVQFDILRQTSMLADSFLHREYARWQWRATCREERRCVRAVDLLLATSEQDQQMFEEQFSVRHVAVIPNGIDFSEFAPRSGAGQPGVILFSGLMNYYPNQQAVRWFLDAVFPTIRRKVPTARLVVAGAAPPRWLRAQRGHHVEITGAVPDMRPYLEQASVVIAPLLIGGGTRVKILEAQAMNRPVVSTSRGAEGLGLCHGRSILLADDADTFAEAVIRILDDPEFAARVVASARSHVIRNFDWNRIGERLSRVLHERLGLIPRLESQDIVRTTFARS